MSTSAIAVGILTVSDRASSGEYEDLTGPAVRRQVETWSDVTVEFIAIVPDERNAIAQHLIDWSTSCNLILTNGGTGLGLRDVTPEATLDVVAREVPGIAELMRRKGSESTPFAALSRQVVGQLGHCLIVNLPGSPKGAIESLIAIESILRHACAIIRDDGH